MASFASRGPEVTHRLRESLEIYKDVKSASNRMAGAKKDWQAVRQACCSHLATWELFQWAAKKWFDEEIRQHLEFTDVPLQPLRLLRSHQTQALPKLKASKVLHVEVESAKKIRVQPYGSSHFLPVKIPGKAATIFLNSGFTTKPLRRWLFDTLSMKKQTVPRGIWHVGRQVMHFLLWHHWAC